MIRLFPTAHRIYLHITWETMPITGVSEKTFHLHIFDSKGGEAIPEREIKLSYGMLQPLDLSALAKGDYVIELDADNGEVQRAKLIKN